MKARGRGFIAIAATAVAVGVLASPALGATGDLNFVDCVEDNVTGADSCTLAAEGLNGARELVVSPDGRHVYAVSFNDDAVVTLRRSTTTGALTYQGNCVADDSNPGACAPTAGLNGASSIAISPDGGSVYVGSELDDAVIALQRNATTGALSPLGCVEDNGPPDSGCAVAPALNDVRSVTVSSDGNSVYAAAFAESAIQIFGRAPTGGLSPQGCVKDDAVPGPPACAQAKGLAWVNSVALSPDGASLYATSLIDDAVVRFGRSAPGSALTWQGCVADTDVGDPGCVQSNVLDDPNAVAVSADGRSLYVASSSDHAITHFTRSTADGAIGFQGCVDDSALGTEDACTGMEGLDSPVRVAVSGDGRSVYATANQDHAVAILTRNTASGAVSPQGCVADNDTGQPPCARGADGLAAPWGLAISPNGESVYASSGSGDNAIARFDREQQLAPVPAQRLVAEPVSGKVAVKVPGSSSFENLSDLTAIPPGSVIDTTGGTVSLTSRARAGKRQTARFRFGRFRVGQKARKGAFTELQLVGPLRCGAGGSGAAASAAQGGPVAEAAARRGRRLWGKGKGKFRSRGRKGSGSARGTTWQVSDLCNGKTLIQSLQGRVVARDFVRKRSKILRSGQRYVAPGPRRP